MFKSAKLRPFGFFVIAALGLAAPAQARDILGTAEDAGAFTILLRAAKATDMTEMLDGPGPFTLFAPTDDAFGKLPKPVLEALFKPEGKAKLKEVLTNHVVAGTILSRDVMGKRLEATSLLGQPLLIDATRGITVDGGHLTRADMKADNGVVHVIDTVLVPDMPKK